MLVYDFSYTESLRLFDGTEAQIRLLRRDDAPLLQAGFKALSEETRYRRFFAHKSALTSAEATALTDLDGHERLALCAVGAPDSRVDGILMGVARFAHVSEGAAEAAITVADAFQGRGLGGALVKRLGDAAKERGLTSLTFETFAENYGLARLVRKTFPRTEREGWDGVTLTLRALLEPEEEHEVLEGDGIRPHR